MSILNELIDTMKGLTADFLNLIERVVVLEEKVLKLENKELK